MIKTVLKKLYFTLRSIPLRLCAREASGRVPGEAVSRILVIRLDRIGDLTLSTGLFRALRKRFPGARISALVRERTADLLADNPYIDEVLVYRSFCTSVLRFRRKFDLVLDLLMDYDLKPALLAALLGPAFSVGFDVEGRGSLFTAPVPLSPEKKHFVDHLFDLAAPLGIAAAEQDRAPGLFVGGSRAAEFAPWLAANGVTADSLLVCFHPGGFYPSQRWPREVFSALAKKLLARYPRARILLLGSAAEKSIIDGICGAQDAQDRPRLVKAVDLRLLQTVYLVSRSKLLVGNNSGPVHVAAALGVPTVSTMGPTVPWLWRPYGAPERNIVLRKDLPCSPCTRGYCISHECLRSITADEMFEEARRFLDREA